MNWDKVEDAHTMALFSKSIASKKKRFLGLIIDRVVSYLLAIVLLIIAQIPFPNLISHLEENEILDRLYTIAIILIYYILFEYFFQKSIGKMALRMKVINEYSDTKPTLKQIVGRTFSRIIGWEALAYLWSNELWHDKWSSTMVIDELAYQALLELDEIRGIGADLNSDIS